MYKATFGCQTKGRSGTAFNAFQTTSSSWLCWFVVIMFTMNLLLIKLNGFYN